MQFYFCVAAPLLNYAIFIALLWHCAISNCVTGLNKIFERHILLKKEVMLTRMFVEIFCCDSGI